MTNEEFKAWRRRLDLTQAKAGKALGKNRRTIAGYDGTPNWRGNTVEIPLAVELACKWLTLEARQERQIERMGWSAADEIKAARAK